MLIFDLICQAYELVHTKRAITLIRDVFRHGCSKWMMSYFDHTIDCATLRCISFPSHIAQSCGVACIKVHTSSFPKSGHLQKSSKVQGSCGCLNTHCWIWQKLFYNWSWEFGIAPWKFFRHDPADGVHTFRGHSKVRNEDDEDRLLEATVRASDDKALPGIASNCIQLNGTVHKVYAGS